VTHLTNESGGVAETLSYDPWGKRRNADWSNATGPIFPSETPRGYTGHEHLDDVTVIHMNGRAYDPDTSRMLSPDPYVQAPGFAQSFNRFAYVFNNPLKYTDPSGYCTVAGPSCPMSGFGGFSGGYAVPRLGLSRQGTPRWLRLTITSVRFVPTFSLGSLGLNVPTCVYCGPIINFDTDHPAPRTDSTPQFGVGWSVQVTSTSYSWMSSPIFWPNNEAGNTQAVVGMYEQNYAGQAGSSPLLDSGPLQTLAHEVRDIDEASARAIFEDVVDAVAAVGEDVSNISFNPNFRVSLHERKEGEEAWTIRFTPTAPTYADAQAVQQEWMMEAPAGFERTYGWVQGQTARTAPYRITIYRSAFSTHVTQAGRPVDFAAGFEAGSYVVGHELGHRFLLPNNRSTELGADILGIRIHDRVCEQSDRC
jgi:RHS repeat-associated protein